MSTSQPWPAIGCHSAIPRMSISVAESSLIAKRVHGVILAWGGWTPSRLVCYFFEGTGARGASNKIAQRITAPAAVMQVNRLNDPEAVRKRSKLMLPEPQISDVELEEIAKMGYAKDFIEAGSEEGSGVTRALLSNYARNPLGTTLLQGRFLALCSLLALASLEVAIAGCPFSGSSRRNLLQSVPPAATPSPLPARPTGVDIFVGTPLNYDFYAQSCPTFEQIVQDHIVEATVDDSLAPAFLLRLFFHDCFVQGCDGSLLLNSTVLNLAEKDQEKSATLGKFFVIDAIKDSLEAACPGIVSCADILAAVAVQVVLQAGGPQIYFAYGRRDALDSFATAAQTNMPGGFLHVQGLIENFANQGMNVTDVVALSGAHTIGQTRCSSFIQDRFANTGNNPFPDVEYGQELYAYCLEGTQNGEDRKTALDPNTTTLFDNGYFRSLVAGRGVLTSDADLSTDPRTKDLVALYANNQSAFFTAFAESMRKMSKIGILTGSQGQIRKQCWVRNTIDKVTSPYSNFEFDPISPTICIPAKSTETPVCANSYNR